MDSEPNVTILSAFVERIKDVLLHIGYSLDRLCDLVCPPPLLPCLKDSKHENACEKHVPVENNGFYLWNQDFYEMIYKPAVKFYQELSPTSTRLEGRQSQKEKKTFFNNTYFEEVYFGIINNTFYGTETGNES